LALNFVLDTNAYSDYLRGNESVFSKLNSADIIFFPVIVIGELKRGFYYGRKVTQNLETLGRFLTKSRVRILEINAETAEQYGQLAAYLKRNGTPIPSNDIWIAALCVQYDLPLLTRDSDFQYLPQIQLMTEPKG
jgi:predicted nucleic acid-binding protein